MDFNQLLDRDITIHTNSHKFRGVLVGILTSTEKGVFNSILALKMGVDDFYIDPIKIIAVTVHGREFGKENIDKEEGQRD